MSFCGECGNKITLESTFCQECGTKVDNSIIIDDISNEINTQNEIEEPNTSSKQVFNDPQPVSKTNFGSELSSIPSKIDPLTKYIKGYSYVLMLLHAATSVLLVSSIIHILVNIGVIAVIFNFVRYLNSNFAKSKKYFNGLFVIMIYQIFDSLSIESELSLTIDFLSYFFGGFFTFIVFFLIPVIIVSIVNSKQLEHNDLSSVDELKIVENNLTSLPEINNPNKILPILPANILLYLKISAYVFLIGFGLLNLNYLFISLICGFFHPTSFIAMSIISIGSFIFIKDHKKNITKSKNWYTAAMVGILYLYIFENLILKAFGGELAAIVIEDTLGDFFVIVILLLIPTFNILIMNKPSIFQS